MAPNRGEGPDEKDPYDELDDILNELEEFRRALIKGDGSLFSKKRSDDLGNSSGLLSRLDEYNPIDIEYRVDEDEVYLGMMLPESVSHEDIIVDFSDGNLAVIINLEFEKEESPKEGMNSTYRSTYSVRRSYYLPDDSLTDIASIEYEDGFLEIVVPRNPVGASSLELGDIKNPLDLGPLTRSI